MMDCSDLHQLSKHAKEHTDPETRDQNTRGAKTSQIARSLPMSKQPAHSIRPMSNMVARMGDFIL